MSTFFHVIILLLVSYSAMAQTVWREASFADFSDGAFLDAGSNAYVSAKGRIQMITRWDFNDDGCLDIILPSGHGHTEKENIYIYLNNGVDIDARSRIELPGCGSRAGLVADFDKDGWNDLAVANYRDSHVGWVNAWVYYGSPFGYSAARREELPAYLGQAIAAGDFNGDSWLDLAIACQWQEGDEEHPRGPQQSFIYWNSPRGFAPQNRLALSFNQKAAQAVAADDLDGDQVCDLVILADKQLFIYYSQKNAFAAPGHPLALPIAGTACTIGNVNHDRFKDLAVCAIGKVVLLVGGEAGYDVARALELKVSHPKAVALADVDGDGMDDVIVANYSADGGATWTDSYVFYADGKDFGARQPLTLPTLGASGVCAADLNGDGLPELVFSNERVVNQSNLLSYLYWNMNGRYVYGHHTQLPTQGAVAVTVGDVNGDRRPDVVFFNSEGWLRDGPATSFIYWGDGTRHFSSNRRLELFTHQIFGIGNADLDDDGHVDLILAGANFYNGIPHNQGGLIIYWDLPKQPTLTSHLTMERAYGGVRVADLNRDGYLDILAGGRAIDCEQAGVFGAPIFWGSDKGFQQHNRTLLSIPEDRLRVPLLMDVNKDGYLDIVGQIKDGWIKFWLGSPAGYSEEQITELDLQRDDPLMYIQGADFNKDGWLDLLLPRRGPADGRETTSLIYYGSSQGYTNQNRVEIPCYVTYQNTIADFNKDGWLDLFLCSYGGEVRGNRPSLLYYGSAQGFFEQPRSELPTYGASGSLAADFDNDGWLDLLITNHRRSGSYQLAEPHRHICPSLLYWGGPSGFDAARRWQAMAIGPSGLNVRDLGNSYDRGLYEDYFSSVYEIPVGQRPMTLSWEAATPHGTSVQFQVRTADSQQALESAPWQGPKGKDSWFSHNKAKLRRMKGRFIQYRARLRSPNGAATPYLTAVTIRFMKDEKE